MTPAALASAQFLYLTAAALVGAAGAGVGDADTVATGVGEGVGEADAVAIVVGVGEGVGEVEVVATGVGEGFGDGEDDGVGDGEDDGVCDGVGVTLFASVSNPTRTSAETLVILQEVK